MKKRITVEVEVTIHGYDGKRVIPAFWSEYASVDDESTEITRIGVSEMHPAVWYFFTDAEKNPGNSGYVASMHIGEALQGFMRQWPDLKAWAEKESKSQ